MDRVLRLRHVPVVTLLLGSLTWMLVRGQGHGDGYEPATPTNFRQLFIGRCDEYQHVIFPGVIQPPKNCSELWQKFYDSFAYRDPCDIDVSVYDEFISAAKHDINELNRPLLYWSGPVVPLAYELSAEARRFVNIRYYLPGYMVRNVWTWCGKNSSQDNGMNYVECPDWRTCPEGKMVPSEAFWKALSADLARSVHGEVRLMLNGSSGQAYSKHRTFAKHELPNLEASRNPVLHVYVVHDIEPRTDSVRETCNNCTLLDLRREVEAKMMTFKCYDDPQDVLLLQCVDYPSSPRCQFDDDDDSAAYGQQQLSLSATLASVFIASFIPQR